MEEISRNKIAFLPLLPFLILISFVSFLNNLARVIFSPLSPYMCTDMHLCHADLGNIFLVVSLGFGLTLFSSQFVSSKISHKRTIIVSTFALGIALILSSYARNFMYFRLAAFLIGLSSGLFIPSAVATIRESVDGSHLGKAFGIFATAQSFAFILGPVLTQYLCRQGAWYHVLSVLGYSLIVFSIALIFLMKKGKQRSQPITLSLIRSIFSWPSFWILMILLCLINGLNTGVYNMAPDYFQSHNLLDPESVRRLIIMARIVGIIAAIVGGMIADRFGMRRTLVFLLAICGVSTSLIGMIDPLFALILFAIQSFLAASLMPIIHFAMSTIVSPERNAALVSIMAPFGFTFGAGIIPQILGFFGDFNLYAEGFIIFGAAALCGALLFGLDIIYKHVEISQMKSMEL